MPTNFKNSTRETRRRVLFCVVLLGFAAGLFILPYQFRSEAGSNTRKGFFERTREQPIWRITISVRTRPLTTR